MRLTGAFHHGRGLWIKAVIRTVMVVALAAFTFQSISLPVHSVGHAVRKTLEATSPHSAITADGECTVCDFALHQSISTPTLALFSTTEGFTLHAPALPSPISIFTGLVLPPVRGPPARA